jgi:hypothetical protein
MGSFQQPSLYRRRRERNIRIRRPLAHFQWPSPLFPGMTATGSIL